MRHPGKLILFAVAAAAVVAIGLIGRPRVSTRPLDLTSSGVPSRATLRDRNGWLLLYNFRVVEPGVLYRGSGFPRNRKGSLGGSFDLHPAAFFNGEAFDFLRRNGVRLVVTLETPEHYYGERGYFNYWSHKTGYIIRVKPLPVHAGHAYDKDITHASEKNVIPLIRYPEAERRSGLRAAAEFIDLMHRRDLLRRQPRAQGAVYLHCDAGKDRTGVVVAAYELWRNQGLIDRDRLWQLVLQRYLASNAAVSRDNEARAFAGVTTDCPGVSVGQGVRPGAEVVCPGWLESLRPQLETIAQLN